jgi:hypothetical protein
MNRASCESVKTSSSAIFLSIIYEIPSPKTIPMKASTLKNAVYTLRGNPT